jgi:hypothetical protein
MQRLHYVWYAAARSRPTCWYWVVTFPDYNQATLRTGVECMPQHLEDLARTVLIRPQVHALFEDRLGFWGDDLSRGIRSGELRILR